MDIDDVDESNEVVKEHHHRDEMVVLDNDEDNNHNENRPHDQPAGGDAKRMPQQQQQYRHRPHYQQESPRAFQGGWQGFTLDNNNNNKAEEDEEKQRPDPDARTTPITAHAASEAAAGADKTTTTTTTNTTCLHGLSRWERKAPRSYHVFHFIVVPLLGLIALAFLCGHGVARLEAERERHANSASMLATLDKASRLARLATVALESPRICLESYYHHRDQMYPSLAINSSVSSTSTTSTSNSSNSSSSENGDELLYHRTDLLEYMTACGAELAREINDTVAAFTEEWSRDVVYNDLHFDWTRCHPKNQTAPPRDRLHQAQYFATTWLQRFLELRSASAGGGSIANDTDGSISDVTGNATLSPTGPASILQNDTALIEQIDVSDICEVHGAAGALFWFTVMTTIGYGNATPTTSGGRILVYTMGFLSILLFTAIIGKAGYVALVVADDALHRCRWSRLTRGWTAVAVWAAVFILWIGVIAGVAVAWSRQRMPRLNLPGQEKGSGTERGTLSFRDAIWFSYISVATVGFGDIYIPPDTMQGTDMLYLPLIFLTGFVLLANFLLKLSNVIVDLMKRNQRPSLENLLERTRTNNLPNTRS